jgi:hypothetical protein
MASPFPKQDSITKAQYEALRGSANGNGHATAAIVGTSTDGTVRTCSQCGRELTSKQKSTCSTECQKREFSTKGRKSAAALPKAPMPLPTSPALVPLDGIGNPFLSMLMQAAGVTVETVTVTIERETWRIERIVTNGKDPYP